MACEATQEGTSIRRGKGGLVEGANIFLGRDGNIAYIEENTYRCICVCVYGYVVRIFIYPCPSSHIDKYTHKTCIPFLCALGCITGAHRESRSHLCWYKQPNHHSV